MLFSLPTPFSRSRSRPQVATWHEPCVWRTLSWLLSLCWCAWWVRAERVIGEMLVISVMVLCWESETINIKNYPDYLSTTALIFIYDEAQLSQYLLTENTFQYWSFLKGLWLIKQWCRMWTLFLRSSQVVLYIIVSAACGGLSWPSCVHKWEESVDKREGDKGEKEEEEKRLFNSACLWIQKEAQLSFLRSSSFSIPRRRMPLLLQPPSSPPLW